LPGWSGVWQWASTDCHRFPDIVFAWAGTTPTVETVAAVRLPQLRKQGNGLVVWVSSSSTCGGTLPYLGPYFAAKAAMDALAVSYVAELALRHRDLHRPRRVHHGHQPLRPGGHPAERLSSRPTSSSTRA
jgi:hypothetical protein